MGFDRKSDPYSALALRKDEESRNRHGRIGPSEGWGKALDQVVAHAKTIQRMADLLLMAPP